MLPILQGGCPRPLLKVQTRVLVAKLRPVELLCNHHCHHNCPPTAPATINTFSSALHTSPLLQTIPFVKAIHFFGQVWDSTGEIDEQWKWRHLVYKIIWVTVSFFLTLEIIETLSRPPWTLPKIIVQKFWSRQWLQSAESTPNDGPMNSAPIEPLNFLDLPNLIDLLLLERRIRTSPTHAEQTLE